MSSLTASKKVLRALSLSLGGFQVLLLWKGVSCSFYVYTQKRSFYVVSTSAFIFFILYVKPIRSLLHDPTYTSGIIVPVACFNVL